jgi:hypothetical protein
MLGDDGNQMKADGNSFPGFILGWTIGKNGFNAKTPRRKAAKRHRKLAGDNVPGEREENNPVPAGRWK